MLPKPRLEAEGFGRNASRTDEDPASWDPPTCRASPGRTPDLSLTARPWRWLSHGSCTRVLLSFPGAALPAASASLSALLALAGFSLFWGCLRGGGGPFLAAAQSLPPLAPEAQPSWNHPPGAAPSSSSPSPPQSAGASEDPGFGGSLSGGSGSPVWLCRPQGSEALFSPSSPP